MMLRIGITGGIGSGKSTVAKIFETLGVPVYDADAAAKKMMNEDEALKELIQNEFGNEAYLDAVLNRSFLSSIVFNDPIKLARLNAIIHPATIRDAAAWMQQQNSPYILKEAALIFESGSHENLDKVITVFAPKILRLHRVMQRDNVSKEAVEKRMNQQIDENIKMRLSDYVITNDEQQLLIPQVLKLHEIFSTAAPIP